jgi:response regulator RpfG family c-di-GMP phosphodiesterase
LASDTKQELRMTDANKYVVLIVDDEEMVTTSLRSFLELETDYQVVTFTSPREALGYAQKHPVDLIVSDYLMPDLDGISLLAEIKKVQPQATRVLLTGYADKENAIKAINDVGLYQYIEKPWENADLKLIIQNGLERSDLLRRLTEKVHEVEKAHGELMNIQTDLLKVFI